MTDLRQESGLDVKTGWHREQVMPASLAARLDRFVLHSCLQLCVRLIMDFSGTRCRAAVKLT